MSYDFSDKTRKLCDLWGKTGILFGCVIMRTHRGHIDVIKSYTGFFWAYKAKWYVFLSSCLTGFLNKKGNCYIGLFKLWFIVLITLILYVRTPLVGGPAWWRLVQVQHLTWSTESGRSTSRLGQARSMLIRDAPLLLLKGRLHAVVGTPFPFPLS